MFNKLLEKRHHKKQLLKEWGEFRDTFMVNVLHNMDTIKISNLFHFDGSRIITPDNIPLIKEFCRVHGLK